MWNIWIWENYDTGDVDSSDGEMYSPYLDRKTNVDIFNYTNVLQVLHD